MKIKKLESPKKEVVRTIVDIHLATFPGFFLTFMGRGFLCQMYSCYVKHSRSNLLVAESEDSIVGFLAYSEDMSGLYKYMVKHKLFAFAWYSLGAFFRKPKIFFRLIRAFLKPNEAKREERYVELASIGVRPDVKNKGVGSALINTLKENVNFFQFSYIALETDALNNAGANHFYQKNGFVIAREFVTREGRKMYEYRFGGEKTIAEKENTLHSECGKANK